MRLHYTTTQGKKPEGKKKKIPDGKSFSLREKACPALGIHSKKAPL
jgi:hypothetical protein